MNKSINKLYLCIFLLIAIIINNNTEAQQNALVNTSQSKHATLHPVNMQDVQWTEGFWAEWFKVCENSMLPHMLGNYMDKEVSHAFENLLIAAGYAEGSHEGPPFHDGDFYKMLEAAIAVNSVNQDKGLERTIDSIISVIAKTQRKDGYIHSPVVIEQNKHPEKKIEFAERLDFETYNMGHLMTAACLHYRTTGNKNLLAIAIKATDFLYEFCKRSPEELAKNAICPSHYMGVAEMYRTLGDEKYLELANNLVEIRGLVEDGTDHNQDRIPFKQQTSALGHAVRANYLYAGAADVYAETGDDSLYMALDAIWHDLVEKKLYITGGCGALYDGVSPDGTSYSPPFIQQVHQAYGRDYQLPNLTAHNESCANIGNMLWNWRMYLATGEARFADIMELTMYNSLLAGVSLDGKGYFYTNPLSVNQDITFDLRWSKEREGYISYCNCCPPNTIRTLAEIHNYMYSMSTNGLWFNFYGGSKLHSQVKNGSIIKLQQTTNYPWSGDIGVLVREAPKEDYTMHFRIPSWAGQAEIWVNGKKHEQSTRPNSFASITRKWKQGDEITLRFPMKAMLIEANPLVEETRNQVAIKRGPVVYCLESADMPEDQRVFDVIVPTDINLAPTTMYIGSMTFTALTGEAFIKNNNPWKNTLYKPIENATPEKTKITLIPYYAWGNRGKGDMSVWLGLGR